MGCPPSGLLDGLRCTGKGILSMGSAHACQTRRARMADERRSGLTERKVDPDVTIPTTRHSN